MGWFLCDKDLCHERVNVTLSNCQEKIRGLKSYYKSDDLQACSFFQGLPAAMKILTYYYNKVKNLPQQLGNQHFQRQSNQSVF